MKKLKRRWPVVALGAAVVVAIVVLLAASGGASNALVVYNGRSHYGGEEAFKAFEKQTGIDVELFGGSAEELNQRLKSEGADTDADVLVTVDGANLWRAEQDGLLAPLTDRSITASLPEGLRDPANQWVALSTRIRTPMVSTERVQPGDVTSYESLGDERFRGRLCLRTSNNIYNQALVASFIAERGAAEAEELLRSWMANQPRILGSDVDVLKAIDAGQCDVGLTNHYYLARELKDGNDLKVAPAWADQDGAGVHANISGAAVVKATDRKADAERLVKFLLTRESQEAIAENGEYPAVEGVQPAEVVRSWGTPKLDPIDVAAAGENGTNAVDLMQKVGWK